ncbi:MAG: C25 family cysteine peptidase [Pirellulales bacterium]|nr:C25 family cysteine peptidase [Pirellulales bacterium]
MSACTLALSSGASLVLADGYAIVTTSEIRAASTMLSTFETHKVNRGLNVHVFDETDWGGSGLTGDGASEALRDFLKVAQPEHDFDYLLIIGDPRDNVGPVPMKTMHPRNPDDGSSFTKIPVPSDYYYADMDGNWDLDGDNDYGEFGTITGDFGTGGIDRDHELYVGRMPVYGDSSSPALFSQSVTDLDHILSKTIDYQTATDISWRNHTLIAAEGANRLFYGEQIKDDLLDPNGVSDYRVYDSVGITLSDPPDADICSISNVKAGWDATDPGIVTWLTHGGGSGAAAVMNSSTAVTLDDNYPVMTWQASCLNSDPSNTNNLSYELLINGAVATVGFTEISHGPGSEVDLTSDWHISGIAGLGYGYIERIALDQLTAGQALMELKRDSTLFNRCWYWHNHVGANLYGDPEVSLYDQATAMVPEPSTVMLAIAVVLLMPLRARNSVC